MLWLWNPSQLFDSEYPSPAGALRSLSDDSLAVGVSGSGVQGVWPACAVCSVWCAGCLASMCCMQYLVCRVSGQHVLCAVSGVQGVWAACAVCSVQSAVPLSLLARKYPLTGTPHCTALHCTALHCTALHCTALQRGGAAGCRGRIYGIVKMQLVHAGNCTLHCTAMLCNALHLHITESRRSEVQTTLEPTALHCGARHINSSLVGAAGGGRRAGEAPIM